MNIVDLCGSIFFMSFGLFLAFFHKWAGRKAAEQQYKLLHKLADVLTHINLSEKRFQIAYLLVGIAFIVFGLFELISLLRK